MIIGSKYLLHHDGHVHPHVHGFRGHDDGVHDGHVHPQGHRREDEHEHHEHHHHAHESHGREDESDNKIFYEKVLFFTQFKLPFDAEVDEKFLNVI